MATTGLDWRKMAAAACLHVDWSQVAFAALGSADLAGLVNDSLKRLGWRLHAEVLADLHESSRRNAVALDDQTPPVETPAPASEKASEEPTAAKQSATQEAVAETLVDPKARRAAALLGVDIDSSEDAVRAALRSRLSSSRLHPDHGSDGEEATSLIAAKNLLIERLRAMRP